MCIRDRGFTGIEFAALHPALIAPSHITRDGLALFLGEGSVDGGDAVSYTHLDVYKRQIVKR